jgi:hypothetical protein
MIMGYSIDHQGPQQTLQPDCISSNITTNRNQSRCFQSHARLLRKAILGIHTSMLFGNYIEGIPEVMGSNPCYDQDLFEGMGAQHKPS